jgi:hypothetical protein
MAEQRYDLSYRGLLSPGADPDEARRRLGAIFKLKEAGLDRLFTGKPVIVKRDVDAPTAAQFERIFAQAGAELTVVPINGGDAEPEPAAPEEDESPQGLSIDTSMLSLAPPGGVLEEPPPAVSLELDISYLSLVPGDDWTLADCEPPPTPIPLPDLSYLTLVPLPDSENRGGEARFL